MRIFLQSILFQHFFEIQQARFDQVLIHSPEENHLRMLGLLRETTRDLHRLRNGGIRAQLILTRLPDLSAHHEERALKIL